MLEQINSYRKQHIFGGKTSHPAYYIHIEPSPDDSMSMRSASGDNKGPAERGQPREQRHRCSRGLIFAGVSTSCVLESSVDRCSEVPASQPLLAFKFHIHECCPENFSLDDSEGSKSKGLAAGLWCGAAGGIAHMVSDSGWIPRSTHQLLVDLDLADPRSLPAQRESPNLQHELNCLTLLSYWMSASY